MTDWPEEALRELAVTRDALAIAEAGYEELHAALRWIGTAGLRPPVDWRAMADHAMLAIGEDPLTDDQYDAADGLRGEG